MCLLRKLLKCKSIFKSLNKYRLSTTFTVNNFLYLPEKHTFIVKVKIGGFYSNTQTSGRLLTKIPLK